ncbi:DUF5906 domain-containing protein [Staphylococcus cohnii]|uniref:DUF5906 domain-containing protein n=1 Tax=Staphylococcus cohnii TaxID=29382 RepID=UPI00368A17DF
MVKSQEDLNTNAQPIQFPSSNDEDHKIRYNIGTKDGNDKAFTILKNKIDNICNDLDIAISDGLYFIPYSDEYYTISEQFSDLIKHATVEDQIKYYSSLIMDLIDLQKSRITFPTTESKFSKYYLDTLYFIKEGRYPMYKDNSFAQVVKNGYSNHFFAKGQKIMKDLLDIEAEVNEKADVLNSILKSIKELNSELKTISDILAKANENEKNEVTEGCKLYKKKATEFLNLSIRKTEKLCDMLSEPLEKNSDKGVNELAELIDKLFHTAFVSLEDDLGLKGHTKLSTFSEKDEEVLLPIISILDSDANVWKPASRCVDTILSVIDNDTFTVRQSIKVLSNMYQILANDDKNADILVYNPYTIPFNNGNYDVMTKTFNPNPDPFKEPVPARLRVKYNRNANYKTYDKFGITPFDFVTFPFINGDYSPEETKNREIYSGNMIADVLTPFNRDIGGNSIYWFAGDGGSGKTTYVEMIQMLVGNGQSRNIDIASLDTDKFALGDIFGKFLLVGNEATDSGSIGVKKLKEIATGDRVPYEEKFKQSRSSIPTLTPIITSNGAPNLKQDGGASERRFKVIKFNVVFESQAVSDKYKSAKPTKDNPAIKTHALKDSYFLECIANYALDTLEQHAVRNQYSVQIPIPKSVKDDTSDAVKQNDVVHDFAEFLGNKVNKPIPMTAEHLYTVYEVFAQVTGREKFKGNPQKFANEIVTHESIIKLKRDESFDYDGQTLKPIKKMSKKVITEHQINLVNAIKGSQAIDGFSHIDSKSNNIFDKSKTYTVLWIVPFLNNEPMTTDDIFEEKQALNQEVDDSDLAF